MTKIVWKNAKDSPLRRVSKGISVRPLWQGESSAQAMVVEIAPGAKWDGIDAHDNNSEEVFVVSGVFNDGVRGSPASCLHPQPASHPGK